MLHLSLVYRKLLIERYEITDLSSTASQISYTSLLSNGLKAAISCQYESYNFKVLHFKFNVHSWSFFFLKGEKIM